MGVNTRRLSQIGLPAVLVLLLAGLGLAVYRSKPSTAPSLRIVLLGSTNAAATTSSNSAAASFSGFPAGFTPPTAQCVGFQLINSGDRSVRIQNGIAIEQRPYGLPDFNASVFPQTILMGATGTLQPGALSTFVVRFTAPTPLRLVGGGVCKWEFRAVCETGPAEPHWRLLKWLKQQTWSRFLPRLLTAKEVNSYIFFSPWTAE